MTLSYRSGASLWPGHETMAVVVSPDLRTDLPRRNRDFFLSWHLLALLRKLCFVRGLCRHRAVRLRVCRWRRIYVVGATKRFGASLWMDETKRGAPQKSLSRGNQTEVLAPF
jgi:hypothetical protein